MILQLSTFNHNNFLEGKGNILPIVPFSRSQHPQGMKEGSQDGWRWKQKQLEQQGLKQSLHFQTVEEFNLPRSVY